MSEGSYAMVAQADDLVLVSDINEIPNAAVLSSLLLRRRPLAAALPIYPPTLWPPPSSCITHLPLVVSAHCFYLTRV